MKNTVRKYDTLHTFVCPPCTWSHASLLCIITILVYLLSKQVHLAQHFTVSLYTWPYPDGNV